MSDWKRHRNPDDVPTPLAVALSDFCRRAQSPATAAQVREALALIAESDDFRVRAITDAEPPARPLGPFAVIDLLNGATPETAAERQRLGYYALAQALAAERERTAPLPTPAATSGMAPTLGSFQLEAQAPGPQRARKADKAHASTLAERIAPKKRAREDAPAELADGLEAPAVDDLPRRKLPAPRGRFSQVAPPKTSSAELLQPEAKDTLSQLAQQHGHRFALREALAVQYVDRTGAAITVDSVVHTLQRHGLFVALERKERELVLTQYAQHRGAGGRVAWALGVRPSELKTLVRQLHLEREIDELRERFSREALSPANFAFRLDLVGRDKYLADLGIQRRFADSLRGEIRALIGSAKVSAGGFEEAVKTAARQSGVEPELLERAAKKLGLAEEFD